MVVGSGGKLLVNLIQNTEPWTNLTDEEGNPYYPAFTTLQIIDDFNFYVAGESGLLWKVSYGEALQHWLLLSIYNHKIIRAYMNFLLTL